MVHIYRARIYRIILNCIYSLAAAIIAAFVAHFFSKSNVVGIATFVLVLAGFCWAIVWCNIITITIDEKNLTVKKGQKLTVFNREQTSFRAKVVTSRGDTECMLYAKDSSGIETMIDCDLIGMSRFEDMLEKLGLVGEGSEVTKLDTIKKINKTKQ